MQTLNDMAARHERHELRCKKRGASGWRRAITLTMWRSGRH